MADSPLIKKGTAVNANTTSSSKKASTSSDKESNIMKTRAGTVKNLIIIHTYDKGWGGYNDEESWDDIECKYLENDEVFEKWLNENYANKKAEEIKDAEKKAEKDSKFQENFE